MSVEREIEKQVENLEKFISSQKYRKKIIDRVHKDADRSYERRIKDLQKEKQNLEKAREDEVQRLVNARWKEIVEDKVYTNHIEGKVNINGKTVFFSSIKGARLSLKQSYRVESKSSSTTRQKANIGAAIAGDLFFGDIGGIAGGVGLAKSISDSERDIDQIPQSHHLGVNINIDGFESEVVLLNKQVDQESKMFTKAYEMAQYLIAELGTLAHTPVPASYPLIENEPSVVNYTKNISNKVHEIEVAINDTPTYEIPKEYRTKEQQTMTDEDYLMYLDSMNDLKREKDIIEAREERAEKEVHLKSAEKEARIMRGEKSTGEKFATVFLWILDIFLVILGLIFLLLGGWLVTLVSIAGAIVSNPIFYDRINKYKYRYPFWLNYVIYLIAIVLFFVAIILQVAEPKETVDVAISIAPII